MTLHGAAWWAWWSDLMSQVSDRVMCYPAATCALLIMGGQIVATNAGEFRLDGLLCAARVVSGVSALCVDGNDGLGGLMVSKV